MTDQLNFHCPSEAYARAVQSQRKLGNRIADQIERGEPISKHESILAAGIIRQWAGNLSEEQPRKRGRAPEIDPGNVALQYAALVSHGAKKRQAVAKLAESNEVSVEAIKGALKKYKDAIQVFVPDGKKKKK